MHCKTYSRRKMLIAARGPNHLLQRGMQPHPPVASSRKMAGAAETAQELCGSGHTPEPGAPGQAGQTVTG